MEEKSKNTHALAELQEHKKEVATVDSDVVDRDVSKSEFKYRAELKHVENYLNSLKPDDKKKMDLAIASSPEYFSQKVLEYANLGISVSDGDYHISVWGGKVKFDPDYKGMIKVAAMEARKSGYQLLAKADTIRKGFTVADVDTDGLIDTITVKNGKINDEILTAYCILSLQDIQTREIIMQKVEVLPVSEYHAAKSKTKTGGQVYGEFGTEMAKKIAVRRALKIIKAMFASDKLDLLFSDDNQNYEFEKPSHEPQKKLK